MDTEALADRIIFPSARHGVLSSRRRWIRVPIVCPYSVWKIGIWNREYNSRFVRDCHWLPSVRCPFVFFEMIGH